MRVRLRFPSPPSIDCPHTHHATGNIHFAHFSHSFTRLTQRNDSVLIFFERFENPNINNNWDAVWCTLISVSTIGYGDTYPVTAVGQLAVIMGAVLGGTLLIAMVTSVCVTKLALTVKEQSVVDTIYKRRWGIRCMHAAATLIQSAWVRHVRYLEKWRAESRKSMRRRSIRFQPRSRPQISTTYPDHREDMRLFVAMKIFRKVCRQRPTDSDYNLTLITSMQRNLSDFQVGLPKLVPLGDYEIHIEWR